MVIISLIKTHFGFPKLDLEKLKKNGMNWKEWFGFSFGNWSNNELCILNFKL